MLTSIAAVLGPMVVKLFTAEFGKAIFFILAEKYVKDTETEMDDKLLKELKKALGK